MRNQTIAMCLVCLATAIVCGDDWPQILGPSRSSRAIGEVLAGDWETTRPQRQWDFKAGDGYAGAAIVANQVLLFDRVKKQERLVSLDVARGDRKWLVEWPASYAGGMDPDQGPRCVPLVDDSRVYAYGAAGELHCVALFTGKELWFRRLSKEFRARSGYFGAASTPILLGDRLLVNLGGDKASIVALDAETGETAWTSFGDDASYSSPIAWKPPGSDHELAIFVTRLHAIAIEPAKGEILFQIPFGKTGPTVNAASPVLGTANRLFLTASYGIGGKLFDLSGTVPALLWERDDVLSSQYPTPVWFDGHLIGVHGREDGAPAALRCVDAETGVVRWEHAGFGMAHLIVVENCLLALRNDGMLFMLELSTREFRELGRQRVCDNAVRALPALANGTLVVRDTSGNVSAWKLP